MKKAELWTPEAIRLIWAEWAKAQNRDSSLLDVTVTGDTTHKKEEDSKGST